MPLDILSDPVERGKVLALAFVDGPDTFLYCGGSFAEVPWLTISHSKLCFCSSILLIFCQMCAYLHEQHAVRWKLKDDTGGMRHWEYQGKLHNAMGPVRALLPISD
jgi:hypothetical protein